MREFAIVMLVGLGIWYTYATVNSVRVLYPIWKSAHEKEER